MTNLLYRQFTQYYQLPYLAESVENTLSLAAFRYYAFLCCEMNTRSATELHYSNAEIGRAKAPYFKNLGSIGSIM